MQSLFFNSDFFVHMNHLVGEKWENVISNKHTMPVEN